MAHTTNDTTIHKIYSKAWNFVVLQEIIGTFSSDALAQNYSYPAAHILDSLIRNNDSCTETVFYMPCSEKYPSLSQCPGCGYDELQSKIRYHSLQMADDNHALTAPVGMAFYNSWHTDTLINLWSSDNYHPNDNGTYLAACVFYATFFHKSPVGLSYTPLTPSLTAYLQNIAYHTVFDSLSNWNIGVFEPRADFTFTGDASSKTYYFSASASANFNNAYWNFGDGITGSGTQSTHVYADTGNYNVELTITDGCNKFDSIVKSISIALSTSINLTPNSPYFSLSPNPASNTVTLTVDESMLGRSATITDVTGSVVSKFAIVNAEFAINTTGFPNGIYFITIENTTRKLIITK